MKIKKMHMEFEEKKIIKKSTENQNKTNEIFIKSK